jgi:hypothetical protein
MIKIDFIVYPENYYLTDKIDLTANVPWVNDGSEKKRPVKTGLKNVKI